MTQLSPLAVIERLHAAMNAHDIEAFIACFSPNYRSEQPAHPDNAFTGSEQVHKNWSRLFANVPDFKADWSNRAVVGNAVWGEWRWYGTQTDGAPFMIAAAIVFGVEDGKIAWGHLYMEPVEAKSVGIDAQLSRWLNESAQNS